jgi:hypothetical protein
LSPSTLSGEDTQGVRTADSRQQTAGSRQQTLDCRHQTAESTQQTLHGDSRQQTVHSRQQTGVTPLFRLDTADPLVGADTKCHKHTPACGKREGEDVASGRRKGDEKGEREGWDVEREI